MTGTGGPAAGQRVLAVRFGALGDLLFATPALRALCRHQVTPPPCLDVVVGRGMGDALAGLPYVNRVIEWDKRRDASAAGLFAFSRALRRERPDLFLNFQRNARTVVMALLSRAPRVVTMHKNYAPDEQTGRARHALEDYADAVRALGVPVGPDDVARLDFHVPPTAARSLDVRLAEHGVRPGQPLIVVNAGASHPLKTWPPERVASYLDALADAAWTPRDAAFVLCGGPGDVAAANAALARVSAPTRAGRPVCSLAGQTTIKELGALLARADIVVSGDTGPLHVACAVGVPVVALFGATDPNRTYPVAPPEKREIVVSERIAAVAHWRRGRVRSDQAGEGTAEISVAPVLEATRRLLSQNGGAKFA